MRKESKFFFSVTAYRFYVGVIKKCYVGVVNKVFIGKIKI